MVNASPKQTLTRTIARGMAESMFRVVEAARIVFLLSPLYLSLPQSVRAEAIVDEIVAYEEIDETPSSNPDAIARFGPFYVISADTVELNGEIDSATVEDFRRMMSAYPGVKMLRMVECPGTENDDANLAIARAIRKAGITTHVPAGGSVRSGGVELFLAGVKRTAEPGAEFGVHSWQDAEGREAHDVPANDPVHAAYVGYYQEMGLAPDQARAFYAFTNATRFEQVRYMTGPELARFGVLN